MPEPEKWTLNYQDHPESTWEYMFIVSEYYEVDPKKDADNMRKHILLEFLDYLGILKYSKGYDGYYYDIWIKARDE